MALGSQIGQIRVRIVEAYVEATDGYPNPGSRQFI
jgi:hypothetical protein